MTRSIITPPAEVGVGKDGNDTNVVVEYEYWGTPASALPDRTSSSGQSQAQDSGLVTISSDAAPKGINILLEETHAASGVFAATVVICEFGAEGCEAAQEENGDASGEQRGRRHPGCLRGRLALYYP